MKSDLNIVVGLICSFIGGFALALIAVAFGYGLLGASLTYSLGGACVLVLLFLMVPVRFDVADDHNSALGLGS